MKKKMEVEAEMEMEEDLVTLNSTSISSENTSGVVRTAPTMQQTPAIGQASEECITPEREFGIY